MFKLYRDTYSEIVTLNDNNHAQFHSNLRDRRGRGRMVVGFTTTNAISAYHR
jgi:hypothetical protein